MIRNNNLSPLPWYDDINYQNHRKDYAYGNVYQLITTEKKLLPFQFQRKTRDNEISDVVIKSLDGSKTINVTEEIKEAGLEIKRYESDGYDLIIYPGTLPMAINIFEGMYYAEMTDGIDTWYSEVFTVMKNIDNYMCIEWWDEEPFYYSVGHIFYNGNTFKNRIYIPTQVGKPDYDFTEEGEKRDGYFFPEKQVSEKVYKFSFLAPEYLCDSIRIISMSDHIRIRSKGITYDVDNILFTPKWQEQGDLAAVDCEFKTDTVIKKIGKTVTIKNLGDFNNDFNNDFDT